MKSCSFFSAKNLMYASRTLSPQVHPSSSSCSCRQPSARAAEPGLSRHPRKRPCERHLHMQSLVWPSQGPRISKPRQTRRKDGIFRTSKGYCSAPELTVPNILSRCCRRCRRRRPRTAEAPRAALQSLHGSVYNGTSQRIRSRKFFQFSAGAPAPTGPPQLRLLRFGHSWREEAGFAETGAGRKGAAPQGGQAHRAHGGICETV